MWLLKEVATAHNSCDRPTRTLHTSISIQITGCIFKVTCILAQAFLSSHSHTGHTARNHSLPALIPLTIHHKLCLGVAIQCRWSQPITLYALLICISKHFNTHNKAVWERELTWLGQYCESQNVCILSSIYSTGHRQRQNETRLLPFQPRLLLKCKRGRGLQSV